MDSNQTSKNDVEKTFSTETKNTSEEPKCNAKVSRISKSSDSLDSDQEEDNLVIDLDKIPDVVQTPAEKKMDNVFDRILNDVSFQSNSSSKRTSPSCSSNSLLKDGIIKKESVDDTLRGLENLEHCLKEFEGKLKQNASCSKNESKEKTVEVADENSTYEDDQKLQEEMDALLNEFNDIKSTALQIKKKELTCHNSNIKDDTNTENRDTEITTSNDLSSKALKETSEESVKINSKENIGKTIETDSSTIHSNASKETREESVKTNSEENSGKTIETDSSTIENSHELNENIKELSGEVKGESDDTEKRKRSECDTNENDEIEGGKKDLVETEPNSACVSILEKAASLENIKPTEVVNNKNDIVTDTSTCSMSNDGPIIAESKNGLDCRNISSKDPQSVADDKAVSDQISIDSEKTVIGKNSSEIPTTKDVNRVVYRYTGSMARQKSTDDGATCNVCGKDNCICTSYKQDEAGKKFVDTIHTVVNPVRRNSGASNGVKKQQNTSAAWSKLGMRRCENCIFTTDDSSLFDSHSAICSRKLAKSEISLLFADGKFNCHSCCYPTSIRKKFEEHIALHLMAEPYICMTCDITFETKKEIELHVKEKHSKETVKCGLKGSKRIGQIIDNLVKSGNHNFVGRVIGRKPSKTPLESKPLLKSLVQKYSTVPKTSNTSLLTKTAEAKIVNPVTASISFAPKQKENDVIFVSASTVTSVVNTCTSTAPALPTESQTLKPVPSQPAVTTQMPLLLVPVNNGSGSLFIPLSGVPPQTVQTMQNPSTKITPLRFGPQNITLQGSQLQTNVVPQNIETSVKSNQITTPSTLRIAQNFTIQGNTIQPNVIPQGGTRTILQPQSIGQANTINMQNQTRFIIIPPGPISSVVGTNQQQSQLVSLPAVVPLKITESQPTTVALVTSDTVVRPTLSPAQTLATSTVLAATASSALPSINSTVNLPSVPSNTSVTNSAPTQKSTIVETDGNKLFFKKCGELYMCDFCKSETPLEDSFKEHIWKHFHMMQKICKECSSEYDSSTPCKIVLKVMIGLLNSASNPSTQENSTVSKEVVMISDDEEDNNDNKNQVKSKNQKCMDKNEEIIVTDDSGKSTPEPIGDSDLKLKITSTFSLSDANKSDSNDNKMKTIITNQDKVLGNSSCVESNTQDDKASSIDEHNTKMQPKNPEVDTDIAITKANDTSKNDIESTDVIPPEKNQTSSHGNEQSKGLENTEKEQGNKIIQDGKDENIKLVMEFELNNEKGGSSLVVNENVQKENDTTEVEKSTEMISLKPTSDSNMFGQQKDDIRSREEEKERNTQQEKPASVNNTSATTDNNSSRPPHENYTHQIQSVGEDTVTQNVNTESEMDRKPIAFPIVAFYKCGFDGCNFNAAISHEFRDHLSQAHGDALEYKCAHCGQKSFTEDSHVRHLLFHSKPQNSLLFQCGVIGCRFRANLLHIYKDHLEQMHQNVILHRCHSCKDGFPSVKLIIEHLQNNLLKFVQCPYCSMKDGVRRNVLNHIANCHPGKPRQINVTSQLICQERENNEYDRIETKLASNETSGVENTQNQNLGNEHSDNTNLQEEETDVIENDPDDEQMINKITSNPSIMGATYYRCHSCTYLGIGQSKLNKHSEMHKPGFVQQSQRTFVCPECPQSVNILQQFISHLNLHVGEHLCHVYICQHCGFGTNLSNKIQHHVDGTHGSNKLGKDYTQRSIRFSVKVIYCKKCRAAFKTSQAHREHVLKSHGITTNEISGKDDLEFDKAANRIVLNENHRERNMSPTESISISQHHDNEEDTNKRRFTCNECGWATRQLSFLKHHLKKHFVGQDKCQVTLFRCNHCDFDSTSKLIISGHAQNMHAGKLLKVKRIVETIYINESPENDLSIDKFHCDLCTFSCEKVSMLQTHLKDTHSGRKIVHEPSKQKDMYTGPKKEFLIPSGTVFKDIIQCSMCTFRTKKRIELLRHIKIHPSLEPKTETSSSKDSPIAEKIQNPLFESYYKLGMKRKSSSDGNPVVKRPRPPSPTISYDRIMMDTAKRDTGFRKQVATKSTTNRAGDSIKSMLYFLGGDQLHLKLKPCFSELKESSKFYCLICNDVFEDKYKLHKHILQHMKVYFYKCAYCEHGTLDQTQIMVHIQREHRRAIQYSKLDVEEIDSHINKAIHDMKSQVGSGKEKITFEEMPKDTKSEILQKGEAKEEKDKIKVERKDIIVNKDMKVRDKLVTNLTNNSEKEVESKTIDMKKEKVSPSKSYQKEKPFKHWGNLENLPVKEVKKSEDHKENIQVESKPSEDIEKDQTVHPIINKFGDMFICTLCNDECRNRTAANIHARAHSKVRRYMCSLCQFTYVSRWPGDVRKHIDIKHKDVDNVLVLWDDITPCDIAPGGIPYNEHKFCSKNAMPPMLFSDFNKTKKEAPAEDTESDISDIKLNTPSKRPLKIKLSLGSLPEKKANTDEAKNLKKIYKCLVCGKTFKSKHAIHQHFRIECKDPLYGCSLCKFKNVNENRVDMHVKGSHDDNNAEVVERSRCHKIRMYKVRRGKDNSKTVNKTDEEKATSIGTLFKCIVCKRTFKNKNAAMYHAISALCNKTIKKCSQCDFKDVSEDKVESHIKKTHKDKSAKLVELPKEAKIETISSKSSLQMNRHKPGSITFFIKEGSDYNCRLCDFTCQNINSVIQHQEMHNSSPAYRCPYCDVMKSNYIRSVKNHIKARHPKKVVRVKSLRSDTKSFRNKTESQKVVTDASKGDNTSENKCVMHKCLQCNYRCPTYSGVSRHIKRTESCNIPRFKCKECRKFSSINEIEVVEHMRISHNSKELPEICSLKEMTKMIIVKKKSGKEKLDNKKIDSAKNENTEKSRMIEKFSGIKDVDTKVITCPAHSCTFKDKVIKVLEHYRKEHSFRLVKCKMCHLTSKSLGIMFMHFKDFHKLEDYFSTSFLVCSKTREEKENETTEQVDMTDKTKDDKNMYIFYNCDRCEFTARNKNNMRHHIYRHLNYKRFMCRLCKSEFLLRQTVKDHLKKMHSTDSDEFDEIKNERIEKEVEELLDKIVVWKTKEQMNVDEDASSDADIQKKGEIKSKKLEDIEKITTKKENKECVSEKPTTNKGNKECVSKMVTKKNSEITLKNNTDYTKLNPDLFVQLNYIKEVKNKKTSEMEYLCKECPYKSIAKNCAVSHTYKHMPKCMKCPYCHFQGYPRVVVTKHVKAVHADKQAHVIDLRHKVSNSPQRNQKTPVPSPVKKPPVPSLVKKPPVPSPVKKPKKTFLDFDAEIFTSEGSSDEDYNNEDKKRKVPEQTRRTRDRALHRNRKTRYICNFCDYDTDVLYLYRQHLTFHKGFKYQVQGSTLESKNKCGYCGYISTSSKEFDSHMEKHLNSRPFNCPYCPFSQYTPAQVKYHIQNAHRGKKVEVLKDSTSSFLTGDGKVPQTLLVNFEPKVALSDIFTMDSDDFESVLITANVSVIDLHSIPDEQFGNVSKLLGVNGDGSEKTKQNDMIEQTDDEDEVDGDSNMQIDERNYSDVSEDETDDGSPETGDELSKPDNLQNKTSNTEIYGKTSKQITVPEYEDVSDEEMDTENSDSMITVNGGRFFVKSELTYEDISDDDTV